MVYRNVVQIGAVIAGLLIAVGQTAAAQSNTWIELSPTPAMRWVPASYADCTTKEVTANPLGRGFAGIAVGNRQIMYWGGGHHSYPGNDVDLYDIAKNQWIPDSRQPECIAPCCTKSSDKCDNDPVGTSCPLAAYDSHCLIGSCVIRGGTGCSKTAYRCSGGIREGLLCSQDSDCPDGGSCSVGKPTPGVPCSTCRSYTEHTYQHMAYNPERNTFFVYTFSGTYEWNPSTREWIRLAEPPLQTGDQSGRLVMWDPAGSRMLYFQSGGGSKGVYSFSYDTNSWTLVDTMPSTTGWPALFGAYDSSAGKFIITYIQAGTVRWFVYRAATGTWNEITSGAPADVTGPTCGGGGTRPCWASAMAYDSVNGVTAVLTQDPGNSLALWTYSARTDTWSKIPTSGGTGAIDRTGYPNTLVYDGETQSLYLLDVASLWPGQARTLKIRLDSDVTPLPTSSPAETGTAQAAQTPTRTPTRAPTNAPPPPPPTSGTPTACAGRVLQVGPGRSYKRPSEAAADVQTNDCVLIDAGTYANDVAYWPTSASNITIRGVGGMVKLTITNGVVYGSKGIWVVGGDNTTIENIEFACATSRTNNAHCSGILVGDRNDAGIRLEAPGLTVRNCVFRDNDNGILGGPNSTVGGDVLIENSEFYRNGFGDGLSHNLYLNRRNASLTFRYNYTHGAIVGHNLKSRAATNYIMYNRIMDEDNGIASCTDPGSCAGSVEIDLPCGGLVYVIGNLIQKSANADSRDVIKFAPELTNAACPATPYGTQELYVINNTIVSDYGSSTYFIRGYGAAPRLWAKNNIFRGGGTPIVWPSGGTVVQASNVAEDPKLLSPSTYDYHLTAGSGPVLNQGVDPGADARGYDLAPVMQYLYDRKTTVRTSSGALDVGAFEYVTAVTPFPTPTATPMNSATPTGVWTATPKQPSYCSSGQVEAVYPVADSADDGAVSAAGSDYDALVAAEPVADGYSEYYDFATRKNVNGRYVISLVAWRWNTSVRPDGSAWPAGTQVVAAYVRPYWLNKGAGTSGLSFEWHAWPPPARLSASDWTRDPPAVGEPTFAGIISMPTAKGRESLGLNNADANVNLHGYTGLRMGIANATAPAVGEEDSAGVRPRDYQTSAGDQSAQLVVCYVEGTIVAPTPTPALRPTPPRLL